MINTVIIHRVLLVLVTALFVVPALSTHVAPTESVSLIFAKLKMPLLLMIIGLLFLQFSIENLIYRQLLFFSMLYPIYYMFLSIFYKDDFDLAVIFLYFLWGMFVFILVPTWLKGKRLKDFILVLGVSGAIAIIFGFVTEFAGLNLIDNFKDRDSYGFPNPNLYSQFLQMSFYCISIIMLMNNSLTIRRKVVCFGSLFFLFVLAFFAQSRNVQVSMIIFSFFVIISEWKIRPFIISSLIVLSAVGISVLDYKTLNGMSSGRLHIWSRVSGEVTSYGWKADVFGAQTLPDISFIPTYNDKADKNGSKGKFRLDNVYVENFVESGFLGLFLFFLPYIHMMVNAGDSKLATKVLKPLIIAMLFQGIFITNVTSFFAPASLMFGCILIPLYLHGRESVS